MNSIIQVANTSSTLGHGELLCQLPRAVNYIFGVAYTYAAVFGNNT